MEIFVGGIHCCDNIVVSDLSGEITAVAVRNNRADLRTAENVTAAAVTY